MREVNSITIDQHGRVELGDLELQALEATFAPGMAGGIKSVNQVCSNGGDCNGGTNIDCNNATQCGGVNKVCNLTVAA